MSERIKEMDRTLVRKSREMLTGKKVYIEFGKVD